MGRAPLNVLCWLLAERVAQAVPQRALVVLARLSAPMGATPMPVATAAPPRLVKLVLLPPWLLLLAGVVAEVASLPLLRSQTRVPEAWATPLALQAAKLLVALQALLVWVVTAEPTRRLPKALELAAVEAVHTLPTQAAQAALAETRVAVVAGAVRP